MTKTINRKDELNDFDFGDDEVTVNLEADHIAMTHTIGSVPLTLVYDGTSQEIYLRHDYSNEELSNLYPHLDSRAICSIASVFIDLHYYGHDFYSGDFEAILKEWLEEYVFIYPRRDNYQLDQYLLEKETKTLFRNLSHFRLDKCRESEQFTPLIWATPDQIKKQYDHLVRCGYFQSSEE